MDAKLLKRCRAECRSVTGYVVTARDTHLRAPDCYSDSCHDNRANRWHR